MPKAGIRVSAVAMACADALYLAAQALPPEAGRVTIPAPSARDSSFLPFNEVFVQLAGFKDVASRITAPLAEQGLALYAQHIDRLDTGSLVDLFRAAVGGS
jgi:hypothetical protein